MSAAAPHHATPYFDHSGSPNSGRLPPWFRIRLPAEGYGATASAVHQRQLHTVCEEARCPNRSECWGRGTATFMILGETCTRACAFCAVATGQPLPADPDEPRRVAEAARSLGLDFIVLTSVNRDDLADGGAAQFAATLRALRAALPEAGLEILTPDFRQCEAAAVATIDAALPLRADGTTRLVWGHNVETVPSLYREARRGARYQRSLDLLRQVAALPGVEAKSAVMLGLGERDDEVRAVLRDLRDHGVTRLAIGQYLRPTPRHLPVLEYLAPERFDRWRDEALTLGFSWVRSGPLVRSSYHAESAE